jgi:hypothetical protein
MFSRPTWIFILLSVLSLGLMLSGLLADFYSLRLAGSLLLVGFVPGYGLLGLVRPNIKYQIPNFKALLQHLPFVTHLPHRRCGSSRGLAQSRGLEGEGICHLLFVIWYLSFVI